VSRGQATVVGVALLLGLAVVSMGVLTAAVGTVVEDHADRASERHVSTGLADALPADGVGTRRSRLELPAGSLRSVDRDLRVLRGGLVRERVRVGGLVYEAGDRRVAYVAGAVLTGGEGGERLRSPPSVTASAEEGVLVVGAPRLGTDRWAVGGERAVVLETNVSHDRRDLGRGRFTVAIESRSPTVLATWFRERGATVSRRDIDGDGIESVLAQFPGVRRGYLVVHGLALEVET
jgi:hypothetical protein